MNISAILTIVILGLLVVGVILFMILTSYKSQYNNIKKENTQKQQKERETASRRRITPKMKQAVLERDNYTCQICGISKGYLDDLIPHLGDYLLLEIDHIQSVKQGGTGKDEDNLQVLCWRCNRKKGGKKTNSEVLSLIDYGVKYLGKKANTHTDV